MNDSREQNLASIRKQLKEYIEYLEFLQKNQTLLSNDFNNIQTNMNLFKKFENQDYPEDIQDLFH